MPDSSSISATEMRKCSVKGCSHTIAIAECRKMCERCRNTQAEQSRKKRQRKREKEDAEGTLIKRRAPSKPKPPLYRIPNVGLFTERDWEHLDERLFPRPTTQTEPQHPPPDRPPPVMRSDGYARSVPLAKDEGAKELVAVRICHIKSCYQPVPVERKLACIDCHERKVSYTQERKRKRDLEAANEATWTVEDPTLQGYCSVIQFDNDASVQNPSNYASASNRERFSGTQTADIPSILSATGHPLASNKDASHSLLARISPVQASIHLPSVQAPIHLPPVSNEEAPPETVGASLTQAQPNSFSIEESIPTDPFDILPADFFPNSTHDGPHHRVSYERNQSQYTALDHLVGISSGYDDDAHMEEAVEEEWDEEDTQSEKDDVRELNNLLLKACRDGDEAEVKRLLHEGANVNAQGVFDGGNALETASFRGFELIVQLLLDSGADINAEGGDYGNALQAASSDGHESVVKLLLDSGADINAQGGEYGNALQAASYYGEGLVVKLLLDHGADVNAQGGEYGNAFQAASYYGEESVVKLLLDHGADINAEGGYYGSAIQAASWLGHEWVVKFLLDSGADVNAQGGEFGNALQAASRDGNESLVKLLLDHGADVNAPGGRHGDALQAASYSAHKSVVKLLLDHGADVNAQGGEFGNALQAATYWGHESVVKLLLDHGTDINAQGGEYGNALQAASYNGHESTVKVLLDSGADINAQGGKHGNALRAARVRYRDEAVVQLLLSRGAIDPEV